MSRHFDLIVVGAGMAGVAAANKCAAHGWQVAIVDPLPYGGTCALRGCDPKKILRRGAEIIDSASLMRGKGIDDAGLSVNWADLMGHKHGFTDPVPQSMEHGLTGNGVTTMHGRARITRPRQLEIDDVPYGADRFLVATGARPRPLDFPGHEHLIDSTNFLDLEALPPRILFVGGGFISFEFAHIAARAGSSPVIVDRGQRPLKGADPDLVVHGAGRVAELAGLGLDAAGVETGEHGIQVAAHLQSTTNPVIWAAGDSADTAGMPLTPVAVSEAKVATSNMIKGTTAAPDYSGIPTAVFTIPELARVGMLESEARAGEIGERARRTQHSGARGDGRPWIRSTSRAGRGGCCGGHADQVCQLCHAPPEAVQDGPSAPANRPTLC